MGAGTNVQDRLVAVHHLDAVSYTHLSSESESGTGQELEPDGLGAAHEHAESAGRGSHSDGTLSLIHI